MAGIFSMVWLTAFLSFLGYQQYYFDHNDGAPITPQIFPYMVVLIYVSLLFCPFDIFFRSARWGFLYSLSQIFIAPFVCLYMFLLLQFWFIRDEFSFETFSLLIFWHHLSSLLLVSFSNFKYLYLKSIRYDVHCLLYGSCTVCSFIR